MNNMLNAIEKYHDESIEKFGNTSKGVGWNTKECHNLRFEKLCQEIPRNQNITLADLGCGYGAFYEYAKKNNLLIKQYYGYDISNKMLESCQKNLKNHEGINLINSPKITTKVDYIVASGVFNLSCKATKQEWFKHILSTLDNINDNAIKGFAFNLFTNQVDFMRDDLFYADPTFFFNLCREKYSRKVSLYHNYDLWEWTMVITK